jgi:hypothetical protein
MPPPTRVRLKARSPSSRSDTKRAAAYRMTTKRPPESGLFRFDMFARSYSAALVMSASIGSAISEPVPLRRSSRINSSRDVAMRRIWVI